MECLNEVFPVILYFLGSILLVVLIILVLKLMKTLKKMDTVIDDINAKSNKLNGVFDIVDNATDIISNVSDKMVGLIVNGISNLFSKKQKREDDEDE